MPLFDVDFLLFSNKISNIYIYIFLEYYVCISKPIENSGIPVKFEFRITLITDTCRGSETAV